GEAVLAHEGGCRVAAARFRASGPRQELEHAGIGDGPRVAERLVEAPQALAQHHLALEPVLPVRLEPVAGFIDRHAEIDTAEEIGRQRLVEPGRSRAMSTTCPASWSCSSAPKIGRTPRSCAAFAKRTAP